MNPSPHPFEPPGDGLPICAAPGCGMARSNRWHLTGQTRTRVVMVIDHADAYTPDQLMTLMTTPLMHTQGIIVQQIDHLL